MKNFLPLLAIGLSLTLGAAMLVFALAQQQMWPELANARG